MPKSRSSAHPVAWIEKTINTLAPEYRRWGEFAYGASLLSPTKSSEGRDVYHAMRDVNPDDLIIHLVDNEEFDGISFSADSYQVVKLEGKEFYAVRLRNFRRLSPPLNRSVFFGKQFGKHLRQLLVAGLKNTFFSIELKLNQGRYLTPVLPTLMQVLDAAYESISGTTITQVAAEEIQPKAKPGG